LVPYRENTVLEPSVRERAIECYQVFNRLNGKPVSNTQEYVAFYGDFPLLRWTASEMWQFFLTKAGDDIPSR
jgi:hypothetical protein